MFRSERETRMRLALKLQDSEHVRHWCRMTTNDMTHRMPRHLKRRHARAGPGSAAMGSPGAMPRAKNLQIEESLLCWRMAWIRLIPRAMPNRPDGQVRAGAINRNHGVGRILHNQGAGCQMPQQPRVPRSFGVIFAGLCVALLLMVPGTSAGHTSGGDLPAARLK